MTTAHQIQADGKIYTVVDDSDSVYRAVITGSVIDEILDGPLQEQLSVKSDRPDLTPKVVPNGFFALTGYGEPATYIVHITLSAPGFQDHVVTVNIAINTGFPFVVTPPVALRRKPVVVQGRVVANTVARVPIPAAQVAAVDDPAAPPGTPHAVSLRSPLKLAHTAGTTAREITMTPFGGASLNSDALGRNSTLNLSTTGGLAANSVLRFSSTSGTQIEYAIVASLGSGVGQVILRDPLNSSFFAASASVDFLNPGAAGVVGVLSADADPGDGVVTVSQRLDQTIEVDPGAPNVEYFEVGALTDADGYYEIGGVGRAPELFLEASHSGFTSLTRNWFVQYDTAVNVVDFRL